MTSKANNLDELSLFERIEEGVKKSIQDALELKVSRGEGLVIWQDGEPKLLSPEEAKSYLESK